jgi:PLP dependent protein
MYVRRTVVWWYLAPFVASKHCCAYSAITTSTKFARGIHKNFIFVNPALIRSRSDTENIADSQYQPRGLLWITTRDASTSFATGIRMLSTTDMDSALDIAANYCAVQDRVQKAASAISANGNVRLVAVSKTKPIELLQVAYDAGCRCFGENYVQELALKTELWKDRADVQWHFIGALQSNKCQTLVNCCENISQLTVETISSTKLANKLNNAVLGKQPDQERPQRLKIFVQVNTSGEDSKSGTEPGKDCIDLCRHIVIECPGLELVGLMTIGAPGDSSCFSTLAQCRDVVLAAMNTSTSLIVPQLELSMGMSDDFEHAIAAGATNVRVGSTIFGHRDYSAKT